MNVNPYNPKFSELIETAEKVYRERKGWRRGQAYYNVMDEFFPQLSSKIVNTAIDPFNNDDCIPAFLNFVANNLPLT